MSEAPQKFEGVMPFEVTIEGGLSLRILQPKDAEVIFVMLKQDPEISARVTWIHGVKTQQDVEDRIKDFQKKRSLRYAIIMAGDVVGYIGMWPDEGYMDKNAPEGTFGFGYFLKPEARGQGIVHKSSLALMHQAEAVFQIKYWRAYVEDDNRASQAVLKNLGFAPTKGVFDEPVMHTAERCWERTVE